MQKSAFSSTTQLVVYCTKMEPKWPLYELADDVQKKEKRSVRLFEPVGVFGVSMGDIVLSGTFYGGSVSK